MERNKTSTPKHGHIQTLYNIKLQYFSMFPVAEKIKKQMHVHIWLAFKLLIVCFVQTSRILELTLIVAIQRLTQNLRTYEIEYFLQYLL